LLERLRNQITAELAEGSVAVLSPESGVGPRAVPVRYRANGFVLDCLLPRWVETATWLEQDPAGVSLITLPVGNPNLRWLEVQGSAHALNRMDWAETLPRHSRVVAPEELYQLIRIRPRRIHCFDEAAGWGVQATIDL
jgi:hypothetical protein